MQRLIVAAALAVLLGTTLAQAQSFPSRPITIVVALPAGGGVDALARLLADHMKTTLGQPVIVENMGGAGGTISIQRVVRSAPDGYTIGMGTLGQYVISGAVYTLPFDMLKDLEPVALLPSVPYWMVVRKDLPASNLKELVSWLKANKASAATTGTASLARFCGMAFQAATGTDYQFVPYRGGAPALADLVGGQIDLSCDLAASSLAQARAGNVKALAVMTKTRWSAAPDVPTAEESGFPGMLFSHVARLLGAERHTRRHRRQGQCRRQCRHGRPCGVAADGGDGAGLAAGRSAHAGGVRRVPRRRGEEVVPDREGGRRQGGMIASHAAPEPAGQRSGPDTRPRRSPDVPYLCVRVDRLVPARRPGTRAGRLSVEAGQDHRAVRARRRHRYLRPRAGAVPVAVDGPAVLHREPPRRRQHDRHRGGREIGARRLHAADDRPAR